MAAVLVKELGLTKDLIGKIHDLPVEAIQEARLVATPTNYWIASVDGKILPRKTFDPTAPEINADVPMMVFDNTCEVKLDHDGAVRKAMGEA